MELKFYFWLSIVFLRSYEFDSVGTEDVGKSSSNTWLTHLLIDSLVLS